MLHMYTCCRRNPYRSYCRRHPTAAAAPAARLRRTHRDETGCQCCIGSRIFLQLQPSAVTKKSPWSGRRPTPFWKPAQPSCNREYLGFRTYIFTRIHSRKWVFSREARLGHRLGSVSCRRSTGPVQGILWEVREAKTTTPSCYFQRQTPSQASSLASIVVNRTDTLPVTDGVRERLWLLAILGIAGAAQRIQRTEPPMIWSRGSASPLSYLLQQTPSVFALLLQ